MKVLAAIHVALKQLTIEQEDARDLYERVTGKRSLRAMNAAEQQRVVEELRRRGFRNSASMGARKQLEGKFAKKLQALWIAAWNLGIVENREDEALLAFVKRQTGIDHRRDILAVTREFRSIRKAIDDLERRQASSILTGRVAAVDGDRVRLELLPEDSRTGKSFLSPWVQVQEAAGATGSHFPVQVGDPMRLLSPNGELGPQSLAVRDGYTSDAPNPSESAQGQLVLAFGGAEIRLGSGKIELVADSVDNVSASLTHEGVNIGRSHRHSDVRRGGSTSGPPTS